MPPARRAVIDVGTNSVKLLVAEVRGQNVQPVLEQSEQTRLGRGLYENHILQPTAIRATAEAAARNLFWAKAIITCFKKAFRWAACGCWRNFGPRIRRALRTWPAVEVGCTMCSNNRSRRIWKPCCARMGTATPS